MNRELDMAMNRTFCPASGRSCVLNVLLTAALIGTAWATNALGADLAAVSFQLEDQAGQRIGSWRQGEPFWVVAEITRPLEDDYPVTLAMRGLAFNSGGVIPAGERMVRLGPFIVRNGQAGAAGGVPVAVPVDEAACAQCGDEPGGCEKCRKPCAKCGVRKGGCDACNSTRRECDRCHGKADRCDQCGGKGVCGDCKGKEGGCDSCGKGGSCKACGGKGCGCEPSGKPACPKCGGKCKGAGSSCKACKGSGACEACKGKGGDCPACRGNGKCGPCDGKGGSCGVCGAPTGGSGGGGSGGGEGKPKPADFMIYLVNDQRLHEPGDVITAQVREAIKDRKPYNQGAIVINADGTDTLLNADSEPPEADKAFKPFTSSRQDLEGQVERVVETIVRARRDSANPDIRTVVVWPERELVSTTNLHVFSSLASEGCGAVSFLCPDADPERARALGEAMKDEVDDGLVTARSPKSDELVEHIDDVLDAIAARPDARVNLGQGMK